MKFKVIILIFILYLPSSFLAMYFAGSSNMNYAQDGILNCFCWDLCRVAYSKRLILVLLETLPTFIFFKYLLKYELKKSILLGLITAFVVEFILYELSMMFGGLFFINQINIGDVIFPFYVCFDRILFVGIIFTTTLTLVRPLYTNSNKRPVKSHN